MSEHQRLSTWSVVVVLACVAICAPSNGQSAIDASTLAGVLIMKTVRSMREIRYGHIVRQQYDYGCGSAALATLLKYGCRVVS
jgi:hypothetical protein